MFAINVEKLQQQQDDAALDQRLDGINDGYSGTPTQSSSWEYLTGFAEGLQRRNLEQLEQAQYLREMAEREDAVARGEADWISELMQHNDEPLLYCDDTEF